MATPRIDEAAAKLQGQLKSALQGIYQAYLDALSQSETLPQIKRDDGKLHVLPRGTSNDAFLAAIRLEKQVLISFFYEDFQQKQFATLEELDAFYELQVSGIGSWVKKYCEDNLSTFRNTYGLFVDWTVKQILQPETLQQFMHVYHLIARQVFLLGQFKGQTDQESGDGSHYFQQLILTIAGARDLRIEDLQKIIDENTVTADIELMQAVVYQLGYILHAKYKIASRFYDPKWPKPLRYDLLLEQLKGTVGLFANATAINTLLEDASSARENNNADQLDKTKEEAAKIFSDLNEALQQVDEILNPFFEKIKDKLTELVKEYDATLAFEQGIKDSCQLYALREQVKQMQIAYLPSSSPMTALQQLEEEIVTLSRLYSGQVAGSNRWISAGTSVKQTIPELKRSFQSFTAPYEQRFPDLEKMDDFVAEVREKQQTVDTLRMTCAVAANNVRVAREDFSTGIKDVQRRLRDVQNLELKPKPFLKRHWWKILIGIGVGCAIGGGIPGILGLLLAVTIGLAVLGAIAGAAAVMGYFAIRDERRRLAKLRKANESSLPCPTKANDKPYTKEASVADDKRRTADKKKTVPSRPLKSRSTSFDRFSSSDDILFAPPSAQTKVADTPTHPIPTQSRPK